MLDAPIDRARAWLAEDIDSAECVVLMHGLNRSWRAMEPLAAKLQKARETGAVQQAQA